MGLAPIALFVYRRPEHTRHTLEALRACPELERSSLHIYCDGAKTPDDMTTVRETRRIARALAPAATFVERDHNFGLARSIIEGTTELCERHGKVIVVEDDLDVAPDFLRFLNAGLDRYADDERVLQVSGYQFPVSPPLAPRALFLSFPTSWGWATWQRAWRHFDADAKGYDRLAADPALRHRFDLEGSYPYFEMLERQRRGEVDSWAIRWHLSVFERDGLVLYPGRSLVANTGFDGSGTHGGRGQGFADVKTTEAAGELPAVALDAQSQRQIFSFLAAATASSPRIRLQHLASKWTRAILANPRIPVRLRAVGTRVLARMMGDDPGTQDLEHYWDPEMAEVLDTWGIGNAWNEIQLLLANVTGKVIDIACGTGKVMTLLAPYRELEVHGFDISDFLIGKAIARGLPRERLRVADATQMPYGVDEFDYGYSIGSLEHFTADGILKFVAEAHRITRRASFHMIPVSRSGRDEGWMKTNQSFHNNSVEWWLERYRSAYPTVHVLESSWHDKISVGKWFVCVKDAAR
ncbi:MAG: methyltransferase domain-containing protein [Kofleriaceae bacterium]